LGEIPREGEDLILPNTERVEMRAVGVVHTNSSKDEIREHKKGLRSQVEIFSQFEEALEGLEGFSHVIIIAYLNQLRPEQKGPLKVQPRALLRHGLKPEELPLVGVFALDSPTRPNPIGLSVVPLLGLENRILTVLDLDLFDGTPVLDVKPYQSSYRTENYRVPDWHERLLKKAGHV
jgi:tRNA-Thr(GGU) m(6)t(6)A37 methyltransferase TsaA